MGLQRVRHKNTMGCKKYRTKRKLIETDIENRLMDMRRGKERVRCVERVTWKLTLPYAK